MTPILLSLSKDQQNGEAPFRGPIPKSPVTIYHIAKAAGVSGATVSRILAGHVTFSPETREKVLLTAQSLGYKVNEHARSLATRRS